MGANSTLVTIVRRHRGRPGGPTPILISKRVRNVLLVGGLIALLLLPRFAPSVPIIVLGGAILALLLSFPVRLLSRVMPRGLALLTTGLALIGLVAWGLVFLLPIVVAQLTGLIAAAPEFAAREPPAARPARAVARAGLPGW